MPKGDSQPRRPVWDRSGCKTPGHSCGTVLHLRGVPLAVIANWLGHADAATTARIYAPSQDDALCWPERPWEQS
ncbi:hypothetical protein H7J89_18500 [Mycobacterium paraffinicum]|uniref:hypothetical protein n=1 Tax=Mycobacterium paraffinicum TaxID=53378 RepID=UPI003558330D|nr:hypothetical protein [Mycobacterium paraffinicum]